VVQDKAFAALTDEGDTTRAGDARAIDVVVATMRGHASSEWVPRFAFMTLRNLPIDEAGNGNVIGALVAAMQGPRARKRSRARAWLTFILHSFESKSYRISRRESEVGEDTNSHASLTSRRVTRGKTS